MVLDKSISAGDESNAVHTDGNNNTTTIINCSKADKQEIEQIVKAILWDNLPVFQSMAKAQVEERMNLFVDKVFTKLSSLNITVEELQAKLSTPDVQYSLAESAKMFAKNPERVDQDTLIDLITQKIDKLDDDNQEELAIIDIAISVVSKLSKSQIRWLALLYYITKGSKFNINEIDLNVDIGKKQYTKENGYFIFNESVKIKCEDIYKLYIKHYYNLDLIEIFYSKLIRIDFSILIGLGCIVHYISPLEGLAYSNPYSLQIKKRVGHDDGMIHHEELQEFYKQINKIFYDISKIDDFRFTSIGEQIALSFLKTTDLSILL